MPLKAPHRGPSLPSTHRPVPSRSVGPDSHSNVIIPLLSVLSCGHSDRPGEAGKGVPVLISEAASFLGYGHDNLVLAVPGKCPAMASVLRTEPLRAHVVPVFGGRLCHSRMWWPGPLPTRCRLETRPMGGAGRRGMMGGAESACVLLPSLSVFLDDPPRSRPRPRRGLPPTQRLALVYSQTGGPGVWRAMVAARPGLPSHSCSRHGHSSQPQRFPKA